MLSSIPNTDQIRSSTYLIVAVLLSAVSVIESNRARADGPQGSATESSGERYEAMVPDTLDLAERAGFALHALTRIPEAKFKHDYPEMCFLAVHPAWMAYQGSGQCQQKPIEAIPMLRVASGSTENEAVDRLVLQSLLNQIDDDGLWWIRGEGRPWRKAGFKQDFVMTAPSGRAINAFLTWNQYSQDPHLLKVAHDMVNGWKDIVMYKDDYAYVNGPTGRYYESGWGSEEETHWSPEFLGVLLRGIARYYAVTGDEDAGELAGKLANFMKRPEFWGTNEPGAGEKGHIHGHFHTLTFNVMGLCEYAIATDDVTLKQLVKGFYEHMRGYGVSRIGWFPAQGPALMPSGQVAEPCCLADMIWLAIKLSDAGVGDYWEDVDQYVRNALVEYQYVDRELMRRISESGVAHHGEDPQLTANEDVVERNFGAFGHGADPTIIMSEWTMCCVANCSAALYYAWESIVRENNGIAQVNLLLNRASPWVDINSYLPYEGKVELINKTAHELRVRLPNWVDKQAVMCQVNGNEITLDWLTNYLVIKALEAGDVVTITFPMVEVTEVHTAPTYGPYTCRFKGNTLVDISPRPEKPSWPMSFTSDVPVYYQLYRRDFYEAKQAPMKKVTRYVAPRIIQW